jgi:hypothetical protein
VAVSEAARVLGGFRLELTMAVQAVLEVGETEKTRKKEAERERARARERESERESEREWQGKMKELMAAAIYTQRQNIQSTKRMQSKVIWR